MSMRSLFIKGKRLIISFPFDVSVLDVVRTLPERDWNKSVKGFWSVPVSSFHAKETISALKGLNFDIASDVLELSKKNGSTPPKTKLALPEGLYPYQKDGVEFIYSARGRAIIGDDMGLGKTAEALVFFNQYGGKKLLVVAPANVVWKWATKEARLWAPGKTVQVIESGKQAVEDKDITVMSYSIMVSKLEELNTIPFDCMIFDEAHYLKSHKSQRSKVAKKLVRGVPYVLFLTGTAFKNKRMELFPLLHMLDPRAWNNPIEFGKRYCGGVFEYGGWVIPPVRETNTAELQERLSPVLLRRTKKQVAIDLPDLTRVMLPVVIDNSIEYKKALKAMREKARSQPYSPANALTIMTELRQLVGLGKVKDAIELAEDIIESGEQVVLFAHHRSVISLLQTALKKYGVGVISGDTKAKERQRLAEEFLSNPALIKKNGLSVMIVSTAGAEGIDLYSANHLIMVEREWTPATEEQIEARLHRNGQKNAVTAHYLIAKDTIDERLEEIVKDKRGEFSRLISTDVIREIYSEVIDEDS